MLRKDIQPPQSVSALKDRVELAISHQLAKNRSFAQGEANLPNEPVWATYETKNILWQARSLWEKGKPKDFPPFDEYIRQEIANEQNLSDHFNILELGSPGGLSYDMLQLFPDQLGTVTTVSFADGRTEKVKQEHEQLGINFIAGDLLKTDTWKWANQLTENRGYNFIYAQLVSGWSTGVPKEPLVSLLLLKRALRLLKPRGILLADYYPDNARLLKERGKMAENFFATLHPNSKLEINVTDTVFWIRRLS